MKTVMLVTAALCAASSFGAIRAVAPQVPDASWTKPWWANRHAEKMGAVTNGGAKVVFLGDSITHFWESQGQAQWKKYFSEGPYKALDLGYSGDRTEHVLWRITEGKELDGYEAKCIVLMIGTNNTGHFPYEKETPIDTIEGVRKVLQTIAVKQPNARTILTAIFPRGWGATDANRRRNDTVNKEICKFADGKKVIWLDFTDKFLAPDGTLSRELFPDLLHPNALGYEIWAGSVIPLIDKVLAASPETVIPSVWPSNPQSYMKDCKTATFPRSGYDWLNYWKDGVLLEHRNAIADNGGKEFDVVFVGDSITHLWTLRGRTGYPGLAVWKKLGEKYNLLNLGVCSAVGQTALWRLQNGELEGYKAKAFAVMIGTNDGGGERAAKGVKDIVDTIRAKHPESKVILMPIFPRGEKPTDERRVSNAKANEIIRGYADGKQVIWLDFNAKFLTPDGTLTREIMEDLLHPTEKGYQIWSEAMAPLLQEIVGK